MSTLHSSYIILYKCIWVVFASHRTTTDWCHDELNKQKDNDQRPFICIYIVFRRTQLKHSPITACCRCNYFYFDIFEYFTRYHRCIAMESSFNFNVRCGQFLKLNFASLSAFNYNELVECDMIASSHSRIPKNIINALMAWTNTGLHI